MEPSSKTLAPMMLVRPAPQEVSFLNSEEGATCGSQEKQPFMHQMMEPVGG